MYIYTFIIIIPEFETLFSDFETSEPSLPEFWSRVSNPPPSPASHVPREVAVINIVSVNILTPC